jgi:GT2 family glycosyltransferase
VRLESNIGFPGAVNAGIAAASSEYIVLLNNDTRADAEWLGRLVAAMDDHPEFAFASSKLLRFDDPGIIDSAGHVYSVWLGAAENIGEGEPSSCFDEPAWIFGACAAASIYRRTLFDDIGVYDADFFFTHEDVEFDLRANVAGYRCLLVPDAVVYHKRGASYEVTPEIHLLGVRNRIWVAGKTMPPLVLFLWLSGKVLRVFWWIPARLLGRTPGRKNRDGTPRGSWDRVPIGVAVKSALDALRRVPAKRRSTARVRRLGSVALLRSIKATRTPRRLDESRPVDRERTA